MIREYYVYQSIWDAAIDGKNLECFREVGNIHDPLAVAIRKDDSVVGHVPRAISAVCSSYICRGGLIFCSVSGSRIRKYFPSSIPSLRRFRLKYFSSPAIVIIPGNSVFRCIYKYWRGKFWQIANYSPNPPKFSPSKIFPRTVI